MFQILALKHSIKPMAQSNNGVTLTANLIHQQLIQLRDAGAAILVITEDLDELYLLADRLGAICGGRLSPVHKKQDVPLERLGQWMTGNFQEEATHAH